MRRMSRCCGLRFRGRLLLVRQRGGLNARRVLRLPRRQGLNLALRLSGLPGLTGG
jgi:hypothetical protein